LTDYLIKGGENKKILLIGDLRRKRLQSRLGTKTSTKQNAVKVTALYLSVPLKRKLAYAIPESRPW